MAGSRAPGAWCRRGRPLRFPSLRGRGREPEVRRTDTGDGCAAPDWPPAPVLHADPSVF